MGGCQDIRDVIAGRDLQIAYFINAHIPNCRGTPFDGDPNCGTYIEVHRYKGQVQVTGPKTSDLKKIGEHPLDAETRQILGDVRVDTMTGLLDGYQTAYLTTHRLCLGFYE